MNRVVLLTLSCMLAFVLISGCGGSSKGPTVQWSGTVTIEGQAIPSDAQGQIIVQSNSATGASRGASADIVNGSYTLPDVPKGEVTVSFDIYKVVPAKDPMDADRGITEKSSLVPERWVTGVADTADKSDSAKNFDLTK